MKFFSPKLVKAFAVLRKMVAEEQMQKLSRQGRTDRHGLIQIKAVKEPRVLSLLLAFVLSLDKAVGGGKRRKSAGTFSPHPLGQ